MQKGANARRAGHGRTQGSRGGRTRRHIAAERRFHRHKLTGTLTWQPLSLAEEA
jgi:hypothetical protein